MGYVKRMELTIVGSMISAILFGIIGGLLGFAAMTLGFISGNEIVKGVVALFAALGFLFGFGTGLKEAEKE